MNKLILAVLLMITGCAVTPLDRQVSIEPRVDIYVPVYPYRGYQFDARLNLYFFWDSGRRFYMPRGWDPRYHRPPRGNYRGQKRGYDWYH